MYPERQILAALLKDRAAYDSLSFILTEQDFSIQGAILYKCITEYYNNDPSITSIDKDLLLSKLRRIHPKHISLFSELLEQLTDCSVKNVIDEVILLKKEKCKNELLGVLSLGKDSEIEQKIQQYLEVIETQFLEEKESNLIHNPDLVTLFSKKETADKIPVTPKVLNDAIGGGVYRGHHIVVFACPEVGKSLFSINLAAGFLARGFKVLYFGNEEPVEAVLDRFLSRLTGVAVNQVRESPAETQKLAENAGLSNLFLIKSHAGSCVELETLVKEYKPDVLIVDQIKNLDIPNTETEMQTVIKASRFMRKIGKQYNCVVVSVTQAGDSAFNKTVLQIRDIYSSKTAVAGDADLMIGIGMNEDLQRNNRRIINLPKNKINGNHAYFSVEVEPLISKVRSL